MRRLLGMLVLLVVGCGVSFAAPGASPSTPPATVALPIDPQWTMTAASGSTSTSTSSTTSTTSTAPATSTTSTSSTSSTTTTSPATSTTSTTSTTAVAPAPGTRGFTAAFSGDTLAHSPLWDQAERNAGGAGFDFTPMLARLRPLLESVDLAVCHLETPIAPEGERYTTAPAYGVPVEVVGAIAFAGYDRCSTASNHVTDRGVAGVDRTISALATYGVEQSGMASRPEDTVPAVFEVAGVAVAHLAYTYGYNGSSFPAGQEWRSARIDPARIVADATRARELGAEVVLVSMHWGVEREAEPSAFQRDVAAQITAGGLVDLVVGHHAHVLQPIEQVNGTWVLYGLGNLLSNHPTSAQWPASSQDGAVVTVRVTVDAAGAVTVSVPEVHPTWVDRDGGWIVRTVRDDLADPDIDAGRRDALAASLARTAAVVGPYIVGGR